MRTKIVLLLALTSMLVPPPASAVEPGLTGQWSAPFWEGGSDPYDPPSFETANRFPTAATAMALPDGRILYWNGLEGSQNADAYIGKADGTTVMENNRTRILDLRSGQPRWTIPNRERGTTDEAKDEGTAATKDLFCGDQKLLYDGTVLTAGGTEWRVDLAQDPLGSDGYGDNEARVFDPRTDTFTNVGPMSQPRWYPSLVTLADGRVLVASGVKRVLGTFAEPDASFSQVTETEIYDPSRWVWEPAGDTGWSLPLFPRLHLLPNGNVFYGGSGQVWSQFGETPDEATWAFQRTYDPATQTWTIPGPSRYGVRGGATSTLLRLEPPYDTAEILLAGGTLGPSPGSAAGTTLSEVVRVTADGVANETEAKSPLAGLHGDLTQLRQPRWFGTSVLFPTGEVMLTGGGDTDDTIDPGTSAAVRTPEIYDPATRSWHEMASARRERLYHHTALLLPDGRVLVGGHAPEPAHFYRHDHPVTRASNYRDATFEIYEPPYLFRGPRPVVDAVGAADGGRALRVDLGAGTEAEDISEVVLVRLPSTTHSVDADMRAVSLEHTVEGSDVVAALPKGGDGRIVPPGPYYVFAMRDTVDGPIPSVAHVVLVQPNAAGGGVAVTVL